MLSDISCGTIYRHGNPTSALNIHCNPLGCGVTNTVIGANMSTGNENFQRYDIFLFYTNPPIMATLAMILRRVFFVKPCGHFGVKWVSILLGNMAYLHIL